jgi:lauroyl/myristoyl acyltransferase
VSQAAGADVAGHERRVIATVAASPGQRLRAWLVAGAARLLAVLPRGPVDALADAAGGLWYRLSPRRAALARRNLERVVRYLAARDLGGPRIAAAATDGAELERLVRAAFRQTVRYYLDMARLPYDNPTEVDARLVVETPETVERAFGPDAPAILVGMHFGAVEYPARLVAARGRRSVLAPMETLANPALQAWVYRTRSSVGVEIIGLRGARRAMAAALAAGRPVGIVADRHVAGGTIVVPFFGAPAPLPFGPALLAVETGRPIYLGAVRRLGGGRYAGRLYAVPVAADGDRRARIRATMATLAEAMAEAIAAAPEQWWSLLLPIWPDLDPRATAGTGRLEPEGDREVAA